MNEPGFDVFAGLWCQEPAEEEIRFYRALAARTGRRAKIANYGEIALGLAIGAGIVAAFVAVPSAAAALVALPLGAAVAWSAWRRHRLLQEEAALSRQDRSALLSSLERSAEAALRRSRIGLVLTLPGWAMTMALAGLVEADGGGWAAWAATITSRLSRWDGLSSMALVAMLMAVLVRRNFRLREERQRIAALRTTYREEDHLDAALRHERSR